jgi:hypothetical protein
MRQFFGLWIAFDFFFYILVSGPLTRAPVERGRPSYYTDKKEKKIFLIYKEIQKGAVTKSYVLYMKKLRKGFLMYEEIRKYSVIYQEAVSHI